MAGANFGKWVKKSAWTIGEAAYLLCGKEPPPSIKSNKDIAAGGAEVDEMYQALKMAARLPGAPLLHPVSIPGEEPETSIVRPTAAPLPGFIQQTRIVREAAPPSYWVTSVEQHGHPIPKELISVSTARAKAVQTGASKAVEEEEAALLDEQVYKEVEAAKKQGIKGFLKHVAKKHGWEGTSNVKQRRARHLARQEENAKGNRWTGLSAGPRQSPRKKH